MKTNRKGKVGMVGVEGKEGKRKKERKSKNENLNTEGGIWESGKPVILSL